MSSSVSREDLQQAFDNWREYVAFVHPELTPFQRLVAFIKFIDPRNTDSFVLDHVLEQLTVFEHTFKEMPDKPAKAIKLLRGPNHKAVLIANQDRIKTVCEETHEESTCK